MWSRRTSTRAVAKRGERSKTKSRHTGRARSLKVEPYADAYQMLLQIEIKFPFNPSNLLPLLGFSHD